MHWQIGAETEPWESWKSAAERGLLVGWLDQGAAHVVPAFGADRVRRHCLTALWAVGDLGFLDAVVAAPITGTTVTVFSFWDSHRCRGVKVFAEGQTWPSILGTKVLVRQSSLPKILASAVNNPGSWCLSAGSGSLFRHQHPQALFAGDQVAELNSRKTGVSQQFVAVSQVAHFAMWGANADF